MSPKTWMRMVYFKRYLKLDILARLGVGYLIFKKVFIIFFNIAHAPLNRSKIKVNQFVDALIQRCVNIILNLFKMPLFFLKYLVSGHCFHY